LPGLFMAAELYQILPMAKTSLLLLS
jgi:hypothetical protein